MANIKNNHLDDKQLKIGDVFTPTAWAEFAIERFGLFPKWLEGATLFDPTMGNGNLLEAFITYGISKGYKLRELPTQKLFGNELNTAYHSQALHKFREKYGLDMRNNFTNEDILRLNARPYDLILGNPPWQNFVDLPESYKEKIKGFFFKYGLVGDSRKLLLGGSRIDIAALIIQISLKDFLKPKGKAYFFMPLSLLLNDGANKHFRTYRVGEVNYQLECVYDFKGEDIFGGIATRYGLAHFVRDKKTSFPIPYFQFVQGKWEGNEAKPLFHPTDPLSVVAKDEQTEASDFPPILLRKESSPRQGINCCGANSQFFFDSLSSLENDWVLLSNKQQKEVILPRKFIFPLITHQAFKQPESLPNKWVLLPYKDNGKPLEWHQIRQHPTLCDYLEQHKQALLARKGVMLNAQLRRGYWWSLLGVGDYNFFPYKIVWEAYGKNTFKPQIFEGHWQANQSLQAFIPVKTLADAQRLLNLLSDKRIENYLLSLKMEGTMNWAQPGKIKKLLSFEEEQLLLF